MKTVMLDGSLYATGKDLHQALKQMLSLPDYYGMNADALNDCLSERRERELIVIEHAGDLLAGCEGYALGLLRVFADNGIQVLLN